MRLLLDTHVLLWCLSEPTRLPAEVRREIENPKNEVFASVVCGWEVEIKRSLGKLDAPGDLRAQIELARFTELPLRFDHVEALRALPSLHRDPFDRILVAQAMADNLVVVSHDPLVLAYGVAKLAV